jgi:hypothetical protein
VEEIVTAPTCDRRRCSLRSSGRNRSLWTLALARSSGVRISVEEVQSVPVLTGDTIYLASLSGEVYALR